MNPIVQIKYIGRKATKRDNVADTGLEWTPGQVHSVPRVAAIKLLRHPDVWVTDEAIDLPRLPRRDPIRDATDPVEDEEEEENGHVRQASVLPNISTMNVKSLVALAKSRFGRDLDESKAAADLRQEIVAMENGGV